MNKSDRADGAARDLLAFIEAMPKAELHVHLEGAIQPETLLALAQRHRRLDVLPASEIAGLRQWFAFTDFHHFIEVYLTISDLVRAPEDFAVVVHACGADMARQNIRYRELTFTPFTHLDIQQKGLTIADLLEGLEAGRQQARRDFGVEMRWIFDVPRNASFRNGAYDPHPANQTLDYAIAGQPYGVVGFGLGGLEVGAPPEPFAHAFADARAAGLILAPHAGETLGPESVWGALRELQAERIGHGVRAIEDPHLLAELKDRQIVLEINPTSNICLHVYRRLAEHPFPHLDRMGLNVTLNSDDPPLFNTTLCDEYALLVQEFGYGKGDLVRIARAAFVAAAAPADLKAGWLAELDTFLATHGED
jgi:aminodeoxyfutalosine deaminase